VQNIQTYSGLYELDPRSISGEGTSSVISSAIEYQIGLVPNNSLTVYDGVISVEVDASGINSVEVDAANGVISVDVDASGINSVEADANGISVEVDANGISVEVDASGIFSVEFDKEEKSDPY